MGIETYHEARHFLRQLGLHDKTNMGDDMEGELPSSQIWEVTTEGKKETVHPYKCNRYIGTCFMEKEIDMRKVFEDL